MCFRLRGWLNWGIRGGKSYRVPAWPSPRSQTTNRAYLQGEDASCRPICERTPRHAMSMTTRHSHPHGPRAQETRDRAYVRPGVARPVVKKANRTSFRMAILQQGLGYRNRVSLFAKSSPTNFKALFTSALQNLGDGFFELWAGGRTRETGGRVGSVQIRNGLGLGSWRPGAPHFAVGTSESSRGATPSFVI